MGYLGNKNSVAVYDSYTKEQDDANLETHSSKSGEVHGVPEDESVVHTGGGADANFTEMPQVGGARLLLNLVVIRMVIGFVMQMGRRSVIKITSVKCRPV